MELSTGWFLLMALLSAGGFAIGRWLGRGHHGRMWLWLTLAMILLGVWSWLYNNPSVAVRVIPLGILAQIEGTAAAPMFMLILGVAWARSRVTRQRLVVLAAAAVGGLYFLHGGLWMLQPMPASALANSSRVEMVMQSQDFSCVPAACATALNALGVPSTEAQMAELTQTRVGEGATLIRAVDGLSQRLGGLAWHVEVVEASLDMLIGINTPVLTAIRTDQQQRHMVVLLAVNKRDVLVADPIDGVRRMLRQEFEPLYADQAIIFRR
ncbi:MAG: hypothetical protein K8S99_15305 [Planctomycetes bacterium]|nr:hypothetical protein [Planctomycetota bacterium]